MAFIRKHRVALVPLFVVAIAGLGLFFLLRSQSEEPVGNVASTYRRETVKAWQENVAKRAQHGREYAFVRTVEYVDPETKEVVTEETVSTVRERATNLCYTDAAGDWQPTVAEWEPGGLGFRMKENSWQIEVPLTLGSAYAYTVGGRTLAMRLTQLVVSDGVRSAFLGQLDTSVMGQIDENDPSKLVFADVLGAGSGVDIELVLQRAALHQNVVLRAKPTLPEGFDAENTRLYIYTELGLDTLTAGGDVKVRVGGEAVNAAASSLVTARNTSKPITFTVEKTVAGERREKILHRFVASRVWDESGPENETVAARQLWRHPFSSRAYLVESVPYSYLAEATGAVTLDYENVNGSIEQDETWTADATYYVTGDVVIGEEVTLTIEPGTVVKFAEDTQINAGIYETESGAKIVAKGEPYNYIVFTSDTDDNCGEDLTPGESTSGTSTYYRVAIEVGFHGDPTSEIEYCKAAFGSWGIVTSRRLVTPVAHCIVDECWCGILVCRGDSTSASDVFNCLVTDCSIGVCAWIRGERPDGFSITNNTIADGCAYGFRVEIEDEEGNAPAVDVKNNLVTECSIAGIARTGSGTGGTWDIDCNGFWSNEDNYVGIPEENWGDNDVVLEENENPYDTTNTQLGSFFIDLTGYGSALEDAGTGNAYDAELYGDGSAGSNTLFDIAAAEAIDDDITSDTTWDKRAVDTGTVDIGYHHPRVDYAIDNTGVDVGSSSEEVTLTIDPGVVVAFYGSYGSLRFESSATEDPTLTCDGDRDMPIVMAGAPSVSTEINTKREGSSSGALRRNSVSADEVVSITYCRFIGLYKALYVSENSADEVMHCVFERNLTGVDAAYMGYPTTFTLKNCLFQNNVNACYILYGYGPLKSITLRNCTFDVAGRGLYINPYMPSYANNATLTFSDCLFSNCTVAGIFAAGVPTVAGRWNEDYNAYWNCEENVWNSYTSQAVAIGDNSIVLTADPYDPDWFDTDDPGSAEWRAQWYLDQDGACVDGGSQTAFAAALATFTTRLDGGYDHAQVDIGYHYGTGLEVTRTHFDNTASGNAGETDISYDYGGNVSYRRIRIYNSGGDLVYEYAPSGEGGTITLIGWDGKGNQGDYNGQDVDTGTYTVVILGGSGGDEYARFRIYIEQSSDASLEIERPDDGQTIDWL